MVVCIKQDLRIFALELYMALKSMVRSALEYFGVAKPFTKQKMFVLARSNTEIRRWAVHNNIYALYKSGFIVRLTNVKQLRGRSDLMLVVLAGGRTIDNYTQLLEGLKNRVSLLLLGYNLSNELINIISERSGKRSERY